MKKAVEKKIKRPRGRPLSVLGPQPSISGRIPKDVLHRLDRWGELNLKSRSEAIAALIEIGLDAEEKKRRHK